MVVGHRLVVGGGEVRVWAFGELVKVLRVSGDVVQVGWSHFDQVYVTILHTEGLVLHSLQGPQWSLSLPCLMDSFWPLPQGIILQRNGQVPTLEETPFLFSLLQCLEEVHPLSFLSQAPSRVVLPPSTSQTSFLNRSFSFNESFSFLGENLDVSGLFEPEDFICEPVRLIFSSQEVPIVVLADERAKSIGMYVAREKHNPLHQCSYEAAQQFAQLRAQYEEEKRKCQMMENLTNSHLDVSFQYEELMTSFLGDESFTLVDAEAHIKAQLYLEWIADFPHPGGSCSEAFTRVDRKGRILLHLLFSTAQILQIYQVSGCSSKGYSIRFLYQLDSILSATPFIKSCSGNRTDLLALDSQGQLLYFWDQIPIFRSDPRALSRGQKGSPIALEEAAHNQVTLTWSDKSQSQVRLCSFPYSDLLVDIFDVLEKSLPKALVEQLAIDTKQWITSASMEPFQESNSPPQDFRAFCSVLLETLQISQPPPVEQPQSDWEFLLSSRLYKEHQKAHGKLAMTSLSDTFAPDRNLSFHSTTNTSQLVQYLESLHRTLHFLFNSFRLNVLCHLNALYLARDLLLPLSERLSLHLHSAYYATFLGEKSNFVIPTDEGLQFTFSDGYDSSVFDIFELLEGTLLSSEPLNIGKEDLILLGANPITVLRQTCRLFDILRGGDGHLFDLTPEEKLTLEGPEFSGVVSTHVNSLQSTGATFPILGKQVQQKKSGVSREGDTYERVLLAMVDESICQTTLDNLVLGVALPLRQAIYHCRQNPPSTWPKEAFILLGRDDLALFWDSIQSIEHATIEVPHPLQEVRPSQDEELTEFYRRQIEGTTWTDSTTLLRFSRDNRLLEVSRLLSSSDPLLVEIPESTGTSEHEIQSLQQQQLHRLAIRTMARPVGRGMFTLSTVSISGTEVVPLPEVQLSGRIPDSNNFVKLVGEEGAPLPDDFDSWGQFHNGVAAGLRITPNKKLKGHTWIMFNKPKASSDGHAGFLLGLGLQGYLKSLKLPKIIQYFKENHPLTRIGILLGLSVNQRGSMDVNVAKLLTVHIPALYPPSSSVVEIPADVQVAAMASVGWLYLQSQHRGMTEMLLEQICFPPLDGKDPRRESSTLAAGLSLGLITLGKGQNCHGLADLRIADRLIRYLTGGVNPRQPDKECDLDGSGLIIEGRSINVDVTGAAATLAYGMMFLQTNDSSAAQRLVIPQTVFLLECVRPDHLLLRQLCRSLIEWDSIAPTQEWMDSKIPDVIRTGVLESSRVSFEDCETLHHCYIHLLAANCLAIGLKFAGTFSQLAFSLLSEQVDLLRGFKSKKIQGLSLLNRQLTETCLDTAVISLSLVMAGSGNLQVMTQIRQLLGRRLENEVTYGHHSALHMALGFLFLGGGKYSLKRDLVAVASLLVSLYPMFPASVNDNRYYLQALRHFYVVACTPRCFELRDVDTKAPCLAPLKVTMLETAEHARSVIHMVAPCLLPEYHLIESITVDSPRYLQTTLDMTLPVHQQMLHNRTPIYIKRRLGHLSYEDDPQGMRSIFARAFPKTFQSQPSAETERQLQVSKTQFIQAFSGDAKIMEFVQRFCSHSNSVSAPAAEHAAFCTAVVYHCLGNGIPEMILFYLQLAQWLDSPGDIPPVTVSNIRLILSFTRSPLFHNLPAKSQVLLDTFLESLESRCEVLLF